MSKYTWTVGFTGVTIPHVFWVPQCRTEVWPAEALGLTTGDVTCKKCQKATRIAKGWEDERGYRWVYVTYRGQRCADETWRDQ